MRDDAAAATEEGRGRLGSEEIACRWWWWMKCEILREEGVGAMRTRSRNPNMLIWILIPTVKFWEGFWFWENLGVLNENFRGSGSWIWGFYREREEGYNNRVMVFWTGRRRSYMVIIWIRLIN